jgi:CheY-like chemotaxis protein
MKDISKCRLLLVDDTKTNIDVLVQGLKDDYKLSIALNGEKALQLVHSHMPDLILLDIMMPGMDGYEVCRRLKDDEETRSIPIIFITAMNEEEDERRGLELGAVDFIGKPFSMPIVKARVRTHLSLKLAFEKLESQNKALLEAARLREDVERMSRHDLKNPLQIILSAPSLIMMMGETNDQQVDLLKRIKGSGYKMLDMINRSLDLFKMEIGAYELNPQPVDLVEIINKICVEHQAEMNAKDIKINMTVNGSGPGDTAEFIVMGEDLLCYSMLSNLIKNAIEASPTSENISVRMQKDERKRIQIHNRGAVPEAICDRFFEKYVTSGKEKGTGLGTYSAKLIAEVQGGTILLDSGETKGTTITISL